MYNFDNFPTIPAVVLRNNASNDTHARYSFVVSGPVARTVPSADFFQRNRISPTETIFHQAINGFDGGGSISGLNLTRLYQLLDDGVPIPLVLDITDMQQCATNYSTNYGPILLEELPVWSHSVQIDCRHAFGLPYSEYLAALRGDAEEWDAAFEVWDKKYPWETKERMAIWRGSESGKGWRKRFVEIVGNATSLIDAHVVTAKYRNKSIPFEEFQKHRAVLDVDGNAWSERFPRLLCMNTPVIKVRPQFLGYQDFTTEAHVHYVPAPLNESLIDVVNWTLAPENEATVRGIVRNARAWCREHMTRRHVLEDVIFQLAAYVAMMDRGSPGWTGHMVEWQKNSTVAFRLFPGLFGGEFRVPM